MLGGFSASKLKPQLKMAVSRIQIASNKKAALLKQNMREIAVMLSEDPPKEEKAKIRAEALIRDDNMIEAYEILQLECELLHERIKLLEFSKDCPPDLVSVVATIMWASQRVDIPELLLIRKQFRAKYGKQFEDDAITNKDGVLNERVVMKLSVHPPAAYLVQTYLERICEQFDVNWTPKVKLSTNELIEPMAAPVGYSVQVAQGTGLGQAVNVRPVTGEEDYKSGNDLPPIVTAKPYLPNGGGVNPAGGGGDFDEVDIFVPGAPSAPPGSTVTTPSGMNSLPPQPPSSTKSKGGGNDDDDPANDDHNNNMGGGDGSGGTPLNKASPSGKATYADLAARFDQLKK